MKKTLAACAIVVLMSPVFGAIGAELRMAVSPFPPFTIVKEGQPLSGSDIDVAKEIAKRMNLELTLVECPWVRCLEKMKDGSIDILFHAVTNPEREAYMLFPSRPYHTDYPFAFYLKKGRGALVKTYEDLYNYTVSFERGAQYFEQFDNDTKIKKDPYPSWDQIFKMLEAGRIDVVLGEKYVLDYVITDLGLKGKFEEAQYRPNIPVTNAYAPMSKQSPLAARFTEYDTVLNQLHDEGVIEQIKQAYFTKYASTPE